jgi:hypothetical protein
MAATSCPRTNIKFSEISYLPSPGRPQWVELINVGTVPVDARSMEIMSGTNTYSLPTDLQEMPTNGFILVYFDGGGTNDTSFVGDNLAVLHASTTNFLGSPVGSVSLYQVTGIHTADTLADYVAWGGDPGTDAVLAVAKGLWNGTNSSIPTQNTPDSGPAGAFAPVVPGGTLDLVAGTWTTYEPSSATPGAPNALLTTPYIDKPLDDQWYEATPDWFRWSPQPGANSYELQDATDSGFTNVVLDVSNNVPNQYFPPSTNTVPMGTNWCRVRAFAPGGAVSAWSASRRFIVGMVTNTTPAPSIKKSGAAPKVGANTIQGTVQDTRTTHGLANVAVSLNAGATVVDSTTTDAAGSFTLSAANGSYTLTGSLVNYTVAGQALTVSANVAGLVIRATGDAGDAAVIPLGAQKDSPLLQVAHSTTDGRMCDKDNARDQAWDQPHAGPHPEGGSLECWYCWAVSATMIGRHAGGSVLVDEVLNNVKNLAFGSDCGAYPADEKNALKFTLQTTEANINYTTTKFTEGQVRNFLTNNRPIFFVEPSHVMTLDGFQYRDGQFWCRFVNTDNRGSTQYRNYAAQQFWRGACPNAGLLGRPVDARIKSGVSFVDGDGDGVLDFDEDTRFSCDKTKVDTDGDGIPDKIEIASWAFPRDGIGGAIAGKEFAPTWGKKAQYTADTDGGGVKDGDEDKNHNGISGKWDTANPGETDVFDPKDDASLDLVFCIDTTGSMGPYIAGVQANMISIINYVATNFSKYRIAIVGYKDYPDQDSSYLNHIYSPFDTNTVNLISTVNSMSVSGGGDIPEAVYSGIIECITDPALGGWRASPVKRVILTMGDAAAHDPEENGTTLATVQAVAGSGGPTYNLPPYIPAIVKSMAAATVDTNTLSGSISVFPVWVGYDATAGASWTNIASVTDGSVVHAPTAADVSAGIISQIDAIKASTTASLSVTGPSGETNVRGLTNIVADASRSFDPNGCGILQYEWDWNGDGIFDETTLGPVTSHAYPAGFTGPIKLRVTTVGGDTATAIFTLAPLPAASVGIVSQTLNTTIDRQTGLFYEQVIVTNSGAATLGGFRISITNLPAGAWCVSATGTNAGMPYVDFTGSLASGATITLKLAYYSSRRQAPVGVVVSVQPVTPVAPVTSTGASALILSARMRPDGKMAVEFDTKYRRLYAIQYSSDSSAWKQAQSLIQGNGSRMIWVDAGPPDTESLLSGVRLYRLVMLPQ